MIRTSDYLLALGAGVLLTGMVSINSLLAKLTTPLFSSWVAHGIGTIISILFVVLLAKKFTPPAQASTETSKLPLWAYAGGITGALTVVVATMAVNSPLGLAGTLALGLVGQIGFGLMADHWGWFGMIKRKLTIHHVISTALIVVGSLLIIAFRG